MQTCIICKKSFPVKPSHLAYGWGIYCSRSCKNQGQQTGKKVPCSTCGNMVYRTPKQLRHASKSKKSFCNKSCFAVWKNKTLFTGMNHVFWKDGHASYRSHMLRSSAQLQCAHCTFHDIRALVVHHKDSNRNNNKTNNLIWLCHNCHYLIHEGKTI